MVRFIIYYIVLFLLLTACNECWRTECVNGGECVNGTCICEDGVERPFCQLDTCVKIDDCKNGHCEYGYCICDADWVGEKCDSLAYEDHSGEYFGSYSCNNTYIITDIIDVLGTQDKDTFRFKEEKSNYRYYVGFETRNNFIIPAQKVHGDEYFYIEVSGSGSIKKDVLEMRLKYREYEFGYLLDINECEFEGDLKLSTI